MLFTASASSAPLTYSEWWCCRITPQKVPIPSFVWMTSPSSMNGSMSTVGPFLSCASSQNRNLLDLLPAHAVPVETARATRRPALDDLIRGHDQVDRKSVV